MNVVAQDAVPLDINDTMWMHNATAANAYVPTPASDVDNVYNHANTHRSNKTSAQETDGTQFHKPATMHDNGGGVSTMSVTDCVNAIEFYRAEVDKATQFIRDHPKVVV